MDLEKLDNTILELEQNSRELKDFVKVYSEISILKNDLLNNAVQLQESNKALGKVDKELTATLESYTKQLNKIDQLLEKRIDELYKDNKGFQKELDQLIISKLEKHKSDIEVSVRNEGTQIQRATENALTSKFNSLDAQLKENFREQAKKLKYLETLLYAAIALGIGAIVLRFVG
ncbi:hypothetical protein D770_24930 [Flammeovirgaceae bacterium 311]|nr:hypothetical protein D770_24930 [Flammeovirgaceae bacterium 311]